MSEKLTATSGASFSRSITRSNALSVRKCIRNDGLAHNSANFTALQSDPMLFFARQSAQMILPETSTTEDFISMKTRQQIFHIIDITLSFSQFFTGRGLSNIRYHGIHLDGNNRMKFDCWRAMLPFSDLFDRQVWFFHFRWLLSLLHEYYPYFLIWPIRKILSLLMVERNKSSLESDLDHIHQLHHQKMPDDWIELD